MKDSPKLIEDGPVYNLTSWQQLTRIRNLAAIAHKPEDNRY